MPYAAYWQQFSIKNNPFRPVIGFFVNLNQNNKVLVYKDINDWLERVILGGILLAYLISLFEDPILRAVSPERIAASTGLSN